MVDVRGIADAFETLLTRSWPTAALAEGLGRVSGAGSLNELRARLRPVFARVHAEHPGAHLCCKDESSNFLAVC